jgi:5-methyltetrahydropteroyltriglutamate--homocysteine methyltransferase
MSNIVKSSNLGYPRIGENREWKKALERFWADEIGQEDFLKVMEQIRLTNLQKQKEQGIDLIPVGDFSLYDHVLDTAVMVGLVPNRFQFDREKVTLETYFNIARGNKGAVASEMTKWFNTNYHYIVPECEQAKPTITENRPLTYYKEAKEKLNIEGKPVILGPITFLKLSKGYNEEEFEKLLSQIVPLYVQILCELEQEGVEWVQIDEPILATTIEKETIDLFKEVYKTFDQATQNLNVLLQTYFESVDYYEEVISLPVQGIGLDFVHDHGGNLRALKKYGFPKNKVLAAGIIDGRNVWRANLESKLELLEVITAVVNKEKLIIQPSCSLLHVPITTRNEENLEKVLKDTLSFADEKLQEVSILTKVLQNNNTANDQVKESVEAVTALKKSSFRNNTEVQGYLQHINEFKTERDAEFKVRQELHNEVWNLPLLPTTTIGSLPQTKEVRQKRLKWRKGEITDTMYRDFVKREIEKWIEIQEEIGLDVLVHGEFERTDMVEYFGEKLGGFQFTKFGWVQSYGSRCVKPPLIYGDVFFTEPITVEETVYAQSLTDKPLKGMLTGPITILNWSFVRDDITSLDVVNQIALALRKEVEALEEHGICMIQIDEPAIREGLPLKLERQTEYLETAVNAFKLSTGSVKNSTQIHTHMCYSDFKKIIAAIDALDADVISIETSRSHGELIQSFEETTYNKGIGLGVYDIHSPRVPKLEEITKNIERAIQVLNPKLFWVNPDCGLKTRGVGETIDALKVMVEAAKRIRKTLLAKI